MRVYSDPMRGNGLLDSISRIVMLVLAGMVSLSIIGAIAAIPGGSIEQRIGLEDAERAAPAPEPEPELRPEARNQGQQVPAAEAGQAGATAVPSDAATDDAARWLETIAYALLALVGLGALAVLLLWRGLAERRRIADALESMRGERF